MGIDKNKTRISEGNLWNGKINKYMCEENTLMNKIVYRSRIRGVVVWISKHKENGKLWETKKAMNIEMGKENGESWREFEQQV